MLHFQLNNEQKEAFEAIQKFIKQSTADTFVLKGYAGTGKTFLMQFLARWLQQREMDFKLLASTGRAATVLRGKTGFEAKTVHGELYQFSKVDGDHDNIPDDAPVDKFGQMTLQFSLRPPDEKQQVYIVDEASMLSSEFTESNSFATFGSGILLNDFFQAAGSSKIIFVGDPSQLPPVGQSFSPALDLDWLAEQRRFSVSATLSKIERTKGDNDILKLAHHIRDLGQKDNLPKYIKLPARNLEQVKLYSSEDKLFSEYVELYKRVGTGGVLAVARSNKKVQEINQRMREELYGDANKPLQVGDVLLVTQNNYAAPLTNGDFVTVISLGEMYMQANLHFQSITIKTALSEKEYQILISLDILYGGITNFSQEQTQNLMVDFSKRMRGKDVKPNSEKYKIGMMSDKYLNSLRATYGYAVTCHKSQGGEWKDVFLFLNKGMYSMPQGELCRWWYTAITRAKERLHTVDDWWINSFSNES